MADKDFVVKNGLVVNSSLLIADSATLRVGINNLSPDATLAVTGTANVVGNVAIIGNSVFTGTANISGNTTITGTANVTGNAYFLTNIAVNANVLLTNTQLSIGNTTSNASVNSTTIFIGNTSVNATINTTSFNRTANNALYLGGTIAAAYVANSGDYTISGIHTYIANIVLGNTTTFVGVAANGTYGNPTNILTSNGSAVFWGTVPSGANTAGGTGAIQYYNGTGLGSNSGFTFAVASNTLSVANSLTLGTAAGSGFILSIGNSSVNSTINSTSFTGIAYTANNSLNLGGTIAANYLTNTGTFTISGTHTHTNPVIMNGAVTIANTLTLNNGSVGTAGQVLLSQGPGVNVAWGASVNVDATYTFTNSITVAATGTTTLNGPVVIANSVSANGRIGDATQVLISGGAGANAYWGSQKDANTSGGTGALQYYNGTTFGSNIGLSFSASSNTLTVSNTLTLGNSSVSATINSTSYTGKAATVTTLTSGQITTALGFTPGTVTSVTNAVSTPITVTGGTSAAVLTMTATNSTSNGFLTSTDWTTFNSKGSGTVTSVTNATGTPITVTTGTTAAVLTMAAATSSVNGYLTSTDWTTFNGKGSGTVTSVSNAVGTPITVTGGTGAAVLTMAAATGSVPGYLTATDWTTFNGKGSGTVTSVTNAVGTPITVTGGTGAAVLTMAAATGSVPGYLTAADWTTFNGKVSSATLASYAPLASPTFTGTPTVPGYVTTATASSTYAPLASPTFTGTPTVPGYVTTATASSTYAPLASPTFTGTPTVPGYLTTATASSTYATTASLSSYALKADVHYIGTTSVALNRASLAQSLTGVSIDGSAGSATGSAATFTSTTQNSQFNSIGIGTAASATAGEIRATNNITAYYSDDRLKTRFNNIENALAKVQSLSGFHYEANELAQSLGYKVIPEVGVSAQEVHAIMPEVVAPAPIDEKYLTVRYERLVPLLIEAIKELKKEIDELKSNK